MSDRTRFRQTMGKNDKSLLRANRHTRNLQLIIRKKQYENKNRTTQLFYTGCSANMLLYAGICATAGYFIE